MSGASAKQPGGKDLPLDMIPSARVVLGVDPSLRGTGWGVLKVDGSQMTHAGSGTVHCPTKWERSRCLAYIADAIRQTMFQHSPEVCVFEGLFFAQNLRTALIMGEARGASMAVVAQAGIPIYEIAPRKAKQAIVGFGGAQKEAVAKMVQRLLHLDEPPEDDAADALALAITLTQLFNKPAARGATRV
ncbi:MAG TPA: crossover junction endodeoxyribonuclease RuvC [Candidatus Limnocylindria bacterium]|jgi:crossover junction endodeoxyribonuclease RuvC|nr:crossover junction endodeoxyribonuclease RuvC [Candidatus Limnocylindria bacterium]